MRRGGAAICPGGPIRLMMEAHCHRTREAMGTRFEVFLSGRDGDLLEAVAVAVLEEIGRLGDVLSRYDPRSEVSRVNREAARAPVRVDRQVFALLARCEEARCLTAGRFDVTASSHLAGGDPAGGAAGGMPALLLDAERCTVRFTRPGVAIDLGGVGKGYALDCGHEIMSQYGVTCGLLQGGTSSVLALGSPPGRAGGAGWPVAVRHPSAPESAPVAVLDLANRGLSCSAVRHPGQRRSDVINPRTGRPLKGNAACVALAAGATEAEIFSTALLAMGRRRATRYLAGRRDGGVDAGWFEPGGSFAWMSAA